MTFVLGCILFLYFGIKFGRVWRTVRIPSIFALLFFLGGICLMLAEWNEGSRSLKLVAIGLFSLGILWRLSGRGRILATVESLSEMLGGGFHENTNLSGKWEEENEERYGFENLRRERERQREKWQENWKREFSVEAHPRAFMAKVSIPVSLLLPSESEGVSLSIAPGTYDIAFDGWGTNAEASSIEAEISLSALIRDEEGNLWSFTYSMIAGDLVLFLFTAPEFRLIEKDVMGWGETPVSVRTLFETESLLAGLRSYTDYREVFDLAYGGVKYRFRTKHFSPLLDLAWSKADNCFYVRLSDLWLCGIHGFDRGELSGDEYSLHREWGDDCAEPLVFAVPPHLLIPLKYNTEDDVINREDSVFLEAELTMKRFSGTHAALGPSTGVATVRSS